MSMEQSRLAHKDPGGPKPLDDDLNLMKDYKPHQDRDVVYAELTKKQKGDDAERLKKVTKDQVEIVVERILDGIMSEIDPDSGKKIVPAGAYIVKQIGFAKSFLNDLGNIDNSWSIKPRKNSVEEAINNVISSDIKAGEKITKEILDRIAGKITKIIHDTAEEAEKSM